MRLCVTVTRCRSVYNEPWCVAVPAGRRDACRVLLRLSVCSDSGAKPRRQVVGVRESKRGHGRCTPASAAQVRSPAGR